MIMKKIEFFKVEGNRINRIRKHCPKCGPAVFLAEHKNRFSCGKCGYAEFKGGGRPSKPPKTEEKSLEQIKTPKKDISTEPPTSRIKPETSTVEEPSTVEPSVDESSKEEYSKEKDEGDTIKEENTKKGVK